jgi:hypothetical protein
LAQVGEIFASCRPANFGDSWLSSGTRVNKPSAEEIDFFARRKYFRPANL